MKLTGTISPEFDIETIHKMRTTVKKMRALGDWSDIAVNKIFRKYYRIAGTIRNVQLLITKIRQNSTGFPISINEWIESRLHHFKVEWQQKYDQHKIENEYGKLKKLLKRRKRKQHSLKFALNKNEQIHSFRNNRPLNDDQIHSGRKMMKEIDYLNKWENNNSDEVIRKLSDATGSFMDTVSELQLLEMYIEQEKDEENRNQAYLLLAKWRQNKENNRIKLLNSIAALPA